MMIRKLLLLVCCAMCAVAGYAEKDITQFMEIPVDGTRDEMAERLKEKGFVPVTDNDNTILNGVVDGVAVRLYIVTNGEKVSRLMLRETETRNAQEIRERYNALVKRFKADKAYVTQSSDTIPETVDVAAGMSDGKNGYEAVFFQRYDVTKVDAEAMKADIMKELEGRYTKEQLTHPTEAIQQTLLRMAYKKGQDLTNKKRVWFKICELNGAFFIAMYYDNVYNG